VTGANSSAAAPPTQPPSGTPTRCGLATASLVCGIAGIVTCGLSAVAGLILGIIALSRIGKSAGQLRGRGLAIAGIIISAATPVLLAMLVAVLLPFVMGALREVQGVQSISNMQQLVCMATADYAEAHDGNLPPSKSWPETFRNYDIDDGILADPSEPHAGRAYAMNARLSDFPLSAVRNAYRTVLFFECRFGAPPGGGPELLPDQPRHPGGYVIGFCDGHVVRVAPQETDELIWDPDQEP